MAGNKQAKIVLQERDRRLLRELAVMKVIDREQASIVAGFGSTTRVNTRLLGLTRAGLLKRLRLAVLDGNPKALYTLSIKGAALIGRAPEESGGKSAQTFSSDLFLEHQLGINSIYLTVKHRVIPLGGVRFRSWKSFSVPLSTTVPLIPDGYLELDSPQGLRGMFIENDLGTEALRVWKTKVEGYLSLATSGEFTRLFGGNQFRVLVLCPSEGRLASIRSAIAQYTDKIFWLATLDVINQGGFWTPVWLRPTGTLRLSILERTL
jgi:hypothetical protein